MDANKAIALSEEEALLVLASNCLNEIPSTEVHTAVPVFDTTYAVAVVIDNYFRVKYKQSPDTQAMWEAARECLAGKGTT